MPLLLSIVGFVISLIVVEVIFRVAQPLLVRQAPTSDRPSFYYAHEGSVTQEGAITLQDYPHNIEKAQSIYRIAIVGDSYSFAPYMQFTDAFPKILERMLNLRLGPRQVEVINYGVPAYSSNHEIQVVQQALRESADLIILQITLNDPEIKPYRPIGITHFDTWGKLKVTGWKKTLLNNWQSLGFFLTRIHNEKTRRDYIQYFINLFEEKRTWNHFSTSVEKMVQITREAKTPLIAVVLPLFGVPLDENYPFHGVHEKIKQLMKHNQVPFLDTYSKFHGIPLERIQVIPGEDRHPNEIGHRITAEAIYDWLEQNNFVPSEFFIIRKYKKRTQIRDEIPFVKDN